LDRLGGDGNAFIIAKMATVADFHPRPTPLKRNASGACLFTTHYALISYALGKRVANMSKRRPFGIMQYRPLRPFDRIRKRAGFNWQNI